ncbi:tannase/feruloyl esterase family alpha/beta hydrolase [Rhodoferax sp. WC2427]|uniref:tannase/feruloyl esterase family alpha/beta hydrolase n=1 Tax=Rhodoferax sp. WC2427 TaxID=3234144 RepID=UPI0034659E39
MKIKTLWGAAIAAVLSLAIVACGDGDTAAAQTPALAIVKPTAACASLASTDLTAIGGVGSTITSATEGTLAINGSNVKFCTVEGTLAPAVGFRVRLPVDTWTQRYAHMGCGGLCGSIDASATPGQAYGCPIAQQGGLVLSSTNMGHTGSEANWSQDAQRRVDFAYRGVHITTEATKKLIQAYYGQAQKQAYFVGCSDGGREGLMAAQRYPTDYNGIVVGAPAFLFNVQNSLHHGWLARSNRDTGLSTGNLVLFPAKVALLHTAVVAACDALDGQTDGILSDPRQCHFDPATIQCAAGASDTSSCLTATEVATATQFYNGPRDPVSNRRILVGGPQYGSELGWTGVFVPASATSTGVFSEMIVGGARNLIFTDATPPTLDQLEFTEAFYSQLRPRHALNDATNPDLSAFKAAGGKLILWHGWADQHISPINTIAYYEAMQKTMGQTAMDGFMRMYLVPGVAHCGGGEGNPNMDMLTAIDDWVLQGKAPTAITTYRTDATTAAVTNSRPVYPYPAVAKYNGTGDATQASSYRSSAALVNAVTPDWAGTDMFTPYAPAPL